MAFANAIWDVRLPESFSLQHETIEHMPEDSNMGKPIASGLKLRKADVFDFWNSY